MFFVFEIVTLTQKIYPKKEKTHTVDGTILRYIKCSIQMITLAERDRIGIQNFDWIDIKKIDKIWKLYNTVTKWSSVGYIYID